MTLRVGTRTSRLAKAQARRVAQRLSATGRDAELVPVSSHGDATRSIPIHRLGVAGAFTARLEQALVDDEVDLAVHSLKDLPLEARDGLELAALLPRGRAEDALIMRPNAHAPGADAVPLARGARVATSGPRRQSQLLAARGDLTVVNVRGNVDTRLGKLRDGWFDALVMARVAVDRAGLDTGGLELVPLDLDAFPCAPGQAAIAVQARAGTPAAARAAKLDDPETRAAVEAERRVLDRLGGGCGLPLGAWAAPTADGWRLRATYAGQAWTPACRNRLERVALDGPDPDDLADDAGDRLAEVAATRRDRPDEVPEGRPVLVVASAPTAAKYTAILHRHGTPAEPVVTRTFEAGDPPDGDTRARLDEVDWIVATSQRAVEPLADLLGDDLPDAYVATVGPATAASLQDRGLPCHLVAPEGTAASMADEIVRLADADAGPVLLALGDTARDEACERLEAAGLETLAWTAYRTREHPVDLDGIEAGLPARAALVMSPRNADALPLDDPDRVAEAYLAIGSSTADALRDRGISPTTLPEPTPEALLEVIE